MGKVEKIIEEIMQDDKEVKELLSKESIDDLYEFFLEKDNTLTEGEFDSEVYNIFENYSKSINRNLKENELEQIAGGKGNFVKSSVALSLAALTFSSGMGSSTCALDADFPVEENAKTTFSVKLKKALNRSANAAKGKFNQISSWINENQDTISKLAIVSVGALILFCVFLGKASRKNDNVASERILGQNLDLPILPFTYVPPVEDSNPLPQKESGSGGKPDPESGSKDKDAKESESEGKPDPESGSGDKAGDRSEETSAAESGSEGKPDPKSGSGDRSDDKAGDRSEETPTAEPESKKKDAAESGSDGESGVEPGDKAGDRAEETPTAEPESKDKDAKESGSGGKLNFEEELAKRRCVLESCVEPDSESGVEPDCEPDDKGVGGAEETPKAESEEKPDPKSGSGDRSDGGSGDGRATVDPELLNAIRNYQRKEKGKNSTPTKTGGGSSAPTETGDDMLRKAKEVVPVNISKYNLGASENKGNPLGEAAELAKKILNRCESWSGTPELDYKRLITKVGVAKYMSYCSVEYGNILDRNRKCEDEIKNATKELRAFLEINKGYSDFTPETFFEYNPEEKDVMESCFEWG